MRASDADRERVVDMLSDHGAAGRLDPEELEERTGTALSARTMGELEVLTADLPTRASRARSAHKAAVARHVFAGHARTYASVMVLLVAIWALTGAGYFWPVWPALGWGIGLACHGASLPRGRRSSKGKLPART